MALFQTGPDPSLDEALSERLVKREPPLIIGALFILISLSWLWVLLGAGLGMSALDMTHFAVFPHRATAADMPGMPVAGFVTSLLMWWAMMAAMMLPAAAPLLLLYGRTIRRGQRLGQIAAGPVPAGWMLAGYLIVWLGFSAFAAGLQIVLSATGLISGMMLWSQSRWLSAGFLALAALFQLSPLKRVCLWACRQPVAYLSRHWQPGNLGALRMGLRHGLDCLGCCWGLMLLLFVGGVMNLLWIAALGGLVLIERLAPFGARTPMLTAGIFALWSVATLLV